MKKFRNNVNEDREYWEDSTPNDPIYNTLEKYIPEEFLSENYWVREDAYEHAFSRMLDGKSPF